MKRNLKQEGMQRAYSVVEVKEIDEDKREITGIATTPSTDRMGDIVEPKGAVFKLPIPLLWQHNRREPIGHVVEAKVTAAGIVIKAKFAKVLEEGKLKDRLDEAWQSVKYGLVRALSIGFDPIEHTQIDGTWGYRFTKWEWLELSAVTLPANSDCSIETVKSIDTETRAALGLTRGRVVRLGDINPGDSGKSTTKATPKGNATMAKKTIQERIAEFTAEFNTTKSALDDIIDKSLEDGASLDAEQKVKHKELSDRLTEIKEHIALLKEHEKIEVIKAPAARVEDGTDSSTALELRSGARIQVRAEKLEKGVAFARYVKCMSAAKGMQPVAQQLAKQHYPHMKELHTILAGNVEQTLISAMLQKAAVAGATTTDATWAGALVEYQLYSQDFIDYLRPLTIIGKFGQNGIPALNRVPFNIEVPRQTSGGTGFWVGQGAPAPLTKFDFDRVQLGWTKLANIAVLTKDIMRFSDPAADILVRNALAEALLAKGDTDFLNPSVDAVANVSPASLTFGVTPVAASGVTADAVRLDVANILKKFIDANLALMNGVWVMSAVTAMRLSLLRNTLGQKEFPELTMQGGRFEGMPVIVSQYLAGSVSGGNMVALMDAGEVYLADDGQVEIDVSGDTSLQMDNAPSNNAATGTGTSLVSMFQTESVAMKAKRTINWAKRRSAAVQYIDATHWGE